MSIDIKGKNLSIKKRYRPEIDGLRAFAVIAVIINHFNKDILPNGYLGVDIFFVISGFVITSSLYQRPSKNFKDFISGFYERRIKRLVPALSVFVLITSIAICLFNPEPKLSIRTGLTSLFGLSNLYLLKQSTDYFAQSTELNVFTHTWSLGVEEQFYILFPFLTWFSGFGRQTKNGARNLFLTIGVLAITSLISFLYLYPINQSAAYFLMPTRFWEMASGCLLFIGFQKRKSIEKLLGKLPPLLILALIVLIMYLPKSWATGSTIGVVVLSGLIIASLSKGTAAYRIFTHPRVVYLGLISYSLYLWHWGVLSISRWTIGIHWWSVPFQFALIFGLAIASYQYIETPLRKGNWFGKRWKTIFFGGCGIITLSGGLITLDRPLKGKLYTAGSYKFEQLITRSRNFDKSERGYSGNNCHFKNKNFKISSSLKNCLIQSEKEQRTFFFSGNSHTDHHRTLHYKLHKENKVNIFSVTISNCTFLGNNCKNNSQHIIRDWILENIKKKDVVVISNRHNPDASPNSKNGWLEERSIKAINKFNKLVLSKGGRLVIFGPTPEYDNSIHLCKPLWFRPFTAKYCTKTIEEVNKERSKVFALINNDLDNTIFVYNPVKDICIDEICSMIDKQSKPLYVDRHHLTNYANSEYLFPGFLSFLKKEKLI